MRIAGIQRTSTIDFPGELACVLFAGGCDFNCFYCHNRALIGGGEEIPPQELEAFLQKRSGLLTGVVVSGGEPTLQSDLPEFLAHLKALDFRVKLDTNGSHPDVVELLLQNRLLDYVAVDWKAPQERFVQVCGSAEGYENAKKTFALLADAGIPYEGRTTLYPGLNERELIDLAACLPPLPRYRLNFFRPPEQARTSDAKRLALPALTPARIDSILPELQKVQPGLEYAH